MKQYKPLQTKITINENGSPSLLVQSSVQSEAVKTGKPFIGMDASPLFKGLVSLFQDQTMDDNRNYVIKSDVIDFINMLVDESREINKGDSQKELKDYIMQLKRLKDYMAANKVERVYY